MTHDEHLMPAPGRRDLDTTLAELAHRKPYEKYGGAAADTHLREYLYVILKRKWLILSIVLVITSLVTVQAYREPSIYEGKTTIRIQAKAPSALPTGAIVINQSDSQVFWGTQLKLLQNPSLARQVVITLGLQNPNSGFWDSQAQSGVFDSLKRIFSREKAVTAIPATGPDVEPVGEEEMKERTFTQEELAKLEPYEDTIGANLTVDAIKETDLVDIRYKHTDPKMAQKIANTLAEVFVQNNQERMGSTTSKAEERLVKEIAKYQEKVKQERDERFNHAKKYGLPLTSSSNNLEAMRLGTYSGQLLQAENDRRTLQAVYEKAKDGLDPFSNPEVQKDALILQIRQRLSDAEEKRSALLQIYTPEWPAVKQLDAQIRSLKQELVNAPKQILSSMKQKYETAKDQEKSLFAAYSKQRGTSTEQVKHEIDLAEMTQNLSTDEGYLTILEQRQRELNSTGSERGTDVTIANYSRFPREPIGPLRLRNILLAFLLSLITGIGLAFLLDFLDDTIKSTDDVERYIHLPTLALIPAARDEKSRLRGAKPSADPRSLTALALVEDARSAISEAYRHLRTSLLLSSAGHAPKTILVTSSQPSEGKTTTAINIAVMLAQTGVEVLIIDCDLRRPRLHANFNISNVRGLTNYLAGDRDLDQLLQPYEKLPNLKLLPSGPVPPNPAELLGSEEMRHLITSMKERFTHIIVDSPPAVSFTDASILSTLVDGVILVVHSGRSSRAVVRRAKQQLLDVGARIFGVALNNVKIESHSYYYAGYYSAYYKSGYENDPDDESVADASS